MGSILQPVQNVCSAETCSLILLVSSLIITICQGARALVKGMRDGNLVGSNYMQCPKHTHDKLSTTCGAATCFSDVKACKS